MCGLDLKNLTLTYGGCVDEFKKLHYALPLIALQTGALIIPFRKAIDKAKRDVTTELFFAEA